MPSHSPWAHGNYIVHFIVVSDSNTVAVRISVPCHGDHDDHDDHDDGDLNTPGNELIGLHCSYGPRNAALLDMSTFSI